MAKTPAEIFKTFADKDVLVRIAEERNIETTDSVKKNIVKHLTAYVISNGLSRTLNTIIPLKYLQILAQPLPAEIKPLPKKKAILSKRIFEEMENVGHRKYLEKVNSKALDDINEHVLDLNVGSSDDSIDAFLKEIEEIGLEYFFSSYSAEQLKEYADLCGLVVTSDSKDVLINSLLTQANYNKPKKNVKIQGKTKQN